MTAMEGDLAERPSRRKDFHVLIVGAGIRRHERLIVGMKSNHDSGICGALIAQGLKKRSISFEIFEKESSAGRSRDWGTRYPQMYSVTAH